MSNGETKPTQRNTQMSEFFPIRRSERKPKTTLLQERQKEIEERICSGKEEGLMVCTLMTQYYRLLA
ncbi:N-lysine methyltransferase KMT5A [Portunus trituberculatus]|uniref:N-lysine methyltransferase KMT5A n=1 Tax=Portunus trituberculatus TaxID=210409 RepID=A0A5B7I907_PORTR|nr:N-lysine methyltransferase KMT5A [Portunus trituberculatus]